MKRKEFGVNTVIGSWTVLGESESTRTPKGVSVRRYRCRCTCGRERNVASNSLARTESRSCGLCGTRSHGPGVATFNATVRHYRNGAVKRELVWFLTDDEVRNLVSSDCHYCGKPACNGIDRKDNSVGYVPANCLPCCKICNYAKLDLSYEEFLAWIRRISQHWQSH